MSTLLDIVSNEPNLKAYTLKLAEGSDAVPSPRDTLEVLFVVARRVLPDNQCTLTYPDYRFPSETQLNTKEIMRFDEEERMKYQTTFLEKWKAIERMANVVGIEEFTPWDCYEPSVARWDSIKRSIDQYLRWCLWLREIIDVRENEASAEDNAIEENLIAIQKRDEELSNNLRLMNEENDLHERKLLLDNKEEFLQLGIDVIKHNNFETVMSELDKYEERFPDMLKEATTSNENLKRQKDNMLAFISEMELSMPKLEKRLNGLKDLKAKGISNTVVMLKSLSDEVDGLARKTSEVSDQISRYESLTESLKSSTTTITDLNERWETLRKSFKLPSLNDLEDKIEHLSTVKENSQKLFEQTESNLKKESQEFEELNKTYTEIEKKLENDQEQVNSSKAILDSYAKRHALSKEELEKTKRDIKAANTWLMHYDSLSRSYGRLISEAIDPGIERLEQHLKYYGMTHAEEEEEEDNSASIDYSMAKNVKDLQGHLKSFPEQDMLLPVQMPIDSPVKTPVTSPRARALASTNATPIKLFQAAELSSSPAKQQEQLRTDEPPAIDDPPARVASQRSSPIKRPSSQVADNLTQSENHSDSVSKEASPTHSLAKKAQPSETIEAVSPLKDPPIISLGSKSPGTPQRKDLKTSLIPSLSPTHSPLARIWRSPNSTRKRLKLMDDLVEPEESDDDMDDSQ